MQNSTANRPTTICAAASCIEHVCHGLDRSLVRIVDLVDLVRVVRIVRVLLNVLS